MQRNVLGSMTSRPVPPSNTGSVLLNWLSDTSLRLLQLQLSRILDRYQALPVRDEA